MSDEVEPPEDDEEERRARAERLRERIRRLEEGEAPEAGEAESPRDFVERRARELEEEERAREDEED